MAPTDLPVTRVLLSQLGHDLMVLAEVPDQADSRCGRRWLLCGKAGRFAADKPMAAYGTFRRFQATALKRQPSKAQRTPR
jgi:hypothetical protein